MDPLVVVRRVGEQVDPLLVDLDPVAGAEFGAYQVEQVFGVLDGRRHRLGVSSFSIEPRGPPYLSRRLGLSSLPAPERGSSSTRTNEAGIL